MKASLLLILLCLAFKMSEAQSIAKDSSAVIAAAKRDAQEFRFTSLNKKAVLHNLNNSRSDYFKPTSTYTSQAILLGDSLYVQTFKMYAIKKTKSRRNTKTLLFIGGGVIVLLGVIVAAAVSAGPGLTN